MRRGVNQHTLEKICGREPVRAIKLANCLQVIEEIEKEQFDAVQEPGTKKGMGTGASRGAIDPASRTAVGSGDRTSDTTRSDQGSSGVVSFLVPLVAGGAVAAYSPKLGMGASGLTLAIAAVYKKDWRWWMVGVVILALSLFFYWNDKNAAESGRVT